MESFYSLLCFMGCASACSQTEALDIIGMLPPEIALMILRKLDGASLVSASRVSRRWQSLVRSDGVLARRLSRQLKAQRRQRQARVFAAGYKPLRTPQHLPKPLADRNGRYATARPDTGVLQRLAAPLGVHRAVKRKNSSSLQSAKQRFAADLHGAVQPMKAMRF